MITVLIVFAIFYYVFKGLFDIPFKNKIENSNSVEESIRTRKALRVARPILSVSLVVIFCVLVFLVDPENGLPGVALIIVLSFTKEFWSKMRGNVQANSKDEYLAKYKDKGYVLYLRAFESDFYSADPKTYSFEGDLLKALEKHGRHSCAIGMTKELDAPFGVERVYVGDESWQSDVKELMQYAESIIVLVSDRQSCIWEISQSVDLLHKTCFVIDSESKYANVKKVLQDAIRFPEFGELLQKLADKREDWEQGTGDTMAELNEKLDKGEIKLGIMIKDNGFDVMKVDDLVAFVEDVYDEEGVANEKRNHEQRNETKSKDRNKKRKRWSWIIFGSLVALLIVVLVISHRYGIALPDWVSVAFIISFAAFILWRWWTSNNY